MKSLEDNKYYVWLSSIIDISTTTKIQLLNEYKDPINIFNATKQMLEDSINIKSETNNLNTKMKQINKKDIIINELINEHYKLSLKRQIEKMRKFDIKVVTYNDKEYPQSLKFINDFPICLFCKGNIELLNKKRKIAIIRM